MRDKKVNCQDFIKVEYQNYIIGFNCAYKAMQTNKKVSLRKYLFAKRAYKRMGIIIEFLSSRLDCPHYQEEKLLSEMLLSWEQDVQSDINCLNWSAKRHWYNPFWLISALRSLYAYDWIFAYIKSLYIVYKVEE